MTWPRLHESEVLIYAGLVIGGAGLWLWFGMAVALTTIGAVLTAIGITALPRGRH